MKSFRGLFILTLAMTLFANGVSAGSGKAPIKKFSGRVIDVADGWFEVKKGRTELTVHFAEGTAIVLPDGGEGKVADVRLCQRVEVIYTRTDGKNAVVKVVITKESDCVK
ncbi:MAG TPA: hypothetical protein ENN21_09070 [Spirochaetes bacterium]|nr:hypothetical protein [Spirochaetota bacterium]